MQTPSEPINCTVKAPKGVGLGEVYPEKESLKCCGITEIVWFDAIMDLVGWNWNMSVAMREYAEKVSDAKVKRMIKRAISGIHDKRVLITGIPVDVQDGYGSDNWDAMPVYNKLRRLLPEFGFKQIGEAYKNTNSGNTIVVFIGKL